MILLDILYKLKKKKKPNIIQQLPNISKAKSEKQLKFNLIVTRTNIVWKNVTIIVVLVVGNTEYQSLSLLW